MAFEKLSQSLKKKATHTIENDERTAANSGAARPKHKNEIVRSQSTRDIRRTKNEATLWLARISTALTSVGICLCARVG